MTAKHGLGEDEIEEVEHPRLGLLKIQAWHEFHFRQAAEAKLSLIRVEQLPTFRTSVCNMLSSIFLGDFSDRQTPIS